MIEAVKRRCGIGMNVTCYDEDIQEYINDCKNDMVASGVPGHLIEEEKNESVLTAVTLYVKAYLGNDRTDTEQYLNLYRQKVFRLTLEGENVE